MPDYTPNMKWAVLGSMGMLGSDLVDYLKSQGESVTEFHRGNLNIESTSSERLTELHGFDVVVNCIAYTKVDLAEDEPEKAHFGNVLVPLKLAVALQDRPTRLIHISTDYVFDGGKGAAYLPEDKRSPIGVYGKTKAMGEELLLDNFSNTQVIRTSWLYGKHGRNFPKTIVAKLLTGEEVGVVSDQFGSPTHALDLAEFIYRAGKLPMTERILHGVSSGFASWYDFAVAIAAQIPEPGSIRAVSTDNYYPTRAVRPLNSTLEPSSIDGWQIGQWEEGWVRASKRILGGY